MLLLMLRGSMGGEKQCTRIPGGKGSSPVSSVVRHPKPPMPAAASRWWWFRLRPRIPGPTEERLPLPRSMCVRGVWYRCREYAMILSVWCVPDSPVWCGVRSGTRCSYGSGVRCVLAAPCSIQRTLYICCCRRWCFSPSNLSLGLI